MVEENEIRRNRPKSHKFFQCVDAVAGHSAGNISVDLSKRLQEKVLVVFVIIN